MTSEHLALRDQPLDTTVIIDDYTAPTNVGRSPYRVAHGYDTIGRGRYVWARIHGAGHNGHLRLLSLDDIVVVPNHAAQSEQVPGWLTVV